MVTLTFIFSTQSSLAIGSVKSGLTDVDSSPLPPPYKNTHTHTHTNLMSWKFELAYLSDITYLCAHACLLS